MAALSVIRDALRSTLLAAVDGIEVYDTVPDVVHTPAVVIAPEAADFLQAFARGHDQWTFVLYVLASRAVADEAQDALDALVSGGGVSSVRQAIFENRGLGLTDGTEAYVSAMSNYGATFETAEVPHIGAVLRVVVLTIGTA